MNSNHLASPQAQPLPTRARTLLAALTNNPHAAFHTGQYQAIEALVAHRRRVLVVQRTGWGKSAVYFIAALLLREQGAGPALIISPLLALMRDQVAAAERAGVRAAMLNSSNVPAAARPPPRAARSGRGALHLRLGARLPPRLPAHRSAH